MTLDELDRLAAEKVMGWKLIEVNAGVVGVEEFWEADDGKEIHVLQWQPTTNIAQAWECLEKMKEYVSMIEVEYYKMKNNKDDWRCVINIPNGKPHGIDSHICLASNAAEAIVKACLKAKGVSID